MGDAPDWQLDTAPCIYVKSVHSEKAREKNVTGEKGREKKVTGEKGREKNATGEKRGKRM